MERKRMIPKAIISIIQPVTICLTLLFCSCNGGQVVYQEQRTPEQRERTLKVIRLIVKARQRIYCLSTDIKQASDANRCFNCHDKIER